MKKLSGYIADLQHFMSSAALSAALLQPRKQGRLYAFCCMIRDACEQCFRSYGGGLYAFDGRVWCLLDNHDFPDIVEGAFIGSAKGAMDAELMKGDWLSNERKLMDYAWKGVGRSRLELSPCIVGFTNGVWDFTDVNHPKGYKFSDRMPIIDLLPYAYNPDLGCPHWLSFLNSMLPARDIMTLQKFFGLGIVGRSVMPQKVEESLWLIGDGANGKSTIQDVMRGVFGKVSSVRLDSLLDRNIDARMRAVAMVEGMVFNMCEEISDADVERGSDMFKSLVSGSPQNARALSKDIWEVTDIPYFVFSMNQKPSNKKMDDAFRRRMVTIEFRSSVLAEDMDRGLGAKLVAEYSGIRNWAIEGYRKLCADGFTTRTDKSAKMTDEDIDDMIANELTVDVWKDAVGISASQHVGHADDEVGIMVKRSVLYQDYSKFCKEKLNCDVVTDNRFGRDLHRLHFESKRLAQGIFYKVYCNKCNKFNINE